MINFPYKVASMSQATPCQNVPVQTSQYNFPSCQQQQTGTQQMQTATCPYGTSQAHQCMPPGTPQPIMSPCQPVFQSACNPPATQPSCGQLPQNILDQIRACISSVAVPQPIFILPGNCQQSSALQQPPTLPQATTLPTAAYPSGLTYPAPCYPPPQFYPYPVLTPTLCDSFLRARETAQNCGCYRRRDVDSEMRSVVARCYDTEMLDGHRCGVTTDDTICSKRNCPSSLHLQALASQFLSIQGVVSCAATRLILRKVPGSNVTTTIEETMAKAQNAINTLTKDQLLSESRNAQQVNALINLHITANPPPNVIPILTQVQLKMNLLKAQIEGLVNQKLMEIQGVGVEVETELIDPAVLALKSDAELRDFLSALRRKECDERVNVNFAPYRSQRAIAETRLSNVQNKIRQVEAEFDRRRCAMLPTPTLTSRVLQQFARPCYSMRLEDARRMYGTLDVPRSPDPFVCAKPPSPKRLFLKPAVKPGAVVAPCIGKTARRTVAVGTGNPHPAEDDPAGSPAPTAPDRQHSSTCTCCDRTTSEESVGEAKKKLGPRITEIDPASELIREPARQSSLVLIPIVGIPCDAKCWPALIKVDDELAGTQTESGSDTLVGEIDAAHIVRRDAIEIRGCVTDRASSANSPWPGQRDEIAISRKDEAIREYAAEIKSSQDVSPPKAEQKEAGAATTARISDDDPISRARETERKSPDTSPPEIILKPNKENEQARKNGETSPSSGATERSTSHALITRNRNKVTFVSLMADIVYDKNRQHRSAQQLDKGMSTDKKEPSVSVNSTIGQLDKYSSLLVDNLLGRVLLRNAVEEESLGSAERIDFSRRAVNRQTALEIVEEDKTAPVPLQNVNIFPPFKNLQKYATGNEKKEGTYSCPIAKARITAGKCSPRLAGVTANIAETTNKSSARFHPNVENQNRFISEIISVIGHRVAASVNKVIALKRKLLYFLSAILRKSLNIDVSRINAAIRHRCGLRDYDHPANIPHRPLGSNRESPGKHGSRDTDSARVSKGEGCTRIHKIRHSIIEEINDTRYLLTGTSRHNLISNSSWEQPYEARRSLLIRSRLKSYVNPQERRREYPFSLLKRTGNKPGTHLPERNESQDTIARREMYKLNGSKKFWSPLEIIEASEKDSETSEMRYQCDDEIKEQIAYEYLPDGAANNATREYAIIGNIAASDELVINVHDYLELRTEINTSVYEGRNRRACLLTFNN